MPRFYTNNRHSRIIFQSSTLRTRHRVKRQKNRRLAVPDHHIYSGNDKRSFPTEKTTLPRHCIESCTVVRCQINDVWLVRLMWTFFHVACTPVDDGVKGSCSQLHGMNVNHRIVMGPSRISYVRSKSMMWWWDKKDCGCFLCWWRVVRWELNTFILHASVVQSLQAMVDKDQYPFFFFIFILG